MKRAVLSIILAASLLLAPVGIVLTEPVPPASAGAKSFTNCTALHKVYKGGVAKKGVKGNKVKGKLKRFGVTPKFSTALYNANKRLDRDKDGIACER